MADVEKDIVLRVKSETDQAQGQFKSLKSELRSMEQQLQQMEASGQAGTEAFKQLQQQAGKVKDQIGDTKNAIKALSSDTFKLDAFAQAAQGIAGGFAAAQGAISLFGGENKAVEEAIKKTQGAMALLQGVTAITNILQKDSAFSLLFLGKAQEAVAVETEVATVATEGFGVALKAVGIGLITAALALLITYWDDVSNAVSKFLDKFSPVKDAIRDFLHTISFGLIDDASTAKTKANAEESLSALEKVAKHNESQEKVIQRKIELAKAEGKSAKEVLALEKELINFRLKNNYAEQDAIKRKIELGNATEDEKKRLYELVESARDLLKDKQLLEINYTNKLKEETQKRIDAQNKESEAKKKQLEKIRGYEAEWEKKRAEDAEKARKEAEDKAKEQRDFEDSEREKALQADLDYFNNYMESKRFQNEEKKAVAKQAFLDGTISEKEYNESIEKLDADSAQKRAEIFKFVVEYSQKAFDTILAFRENQMNQELEMAKGNEKEQEEIRKRYFEKNKKVQIAEAIIQAIAGAQGSFAQVSKSPITSIFPAAPYIAAASALATGLANVQKIRQTQFQGNSSTSSSSSSSPNLAPSGNAMQTNNISSTQLQLDAQGNLKQQQVRTYVLETDISDKQKRSSRLQKTATFGR